MAELFKVNAPVRKPLFEGVQGENEARSIQFDITPWVEELGDGAVTATAKRSQDSQPYPVTVTRDGTTVTWKPTSTDTAYAGVGSFQLEYTVDSVLAKTCIWSTMVAPSLDPAGDPPDPYDNWLAEMRQIAADALQDAQDADASAQDAEAWAKGTKNGTPVPSTADQYQNNSKYFAEESYKNAEAWAVGQRGGVDVPSTDPTYENNSKYWAEQSLANQYGAFIVKSASGDIASFADGADDVPMKSVKVAIVPKQVGSGDPSPSNVRPITGTSTANVFVTGTNAWDEEWEVGSLDITTGANVTDPDCIRSKNYIPVVPSLAYYIYKSASLNFGNLRLCIYDADKHFINAPESLANATITMNENVRFVRFYSRKTSGSASYNSGISINYPSTDHEYHAYNGHTTPVPLGQTVYGGEVNPISGELVIDKAMVDLSTLNWVYSSAYSSWYATKADVKKGITGSQTADCIAEKYATKESNWVILTENTIGIRSDGNYTNIWCRTTGQSDLPSGNFVYPLETPITVQLTSTQVATLLGTNNVWSDTGSVAVEYRADPTLAYAELQALILENM